MADVSKYIFRRFYGLPLQKVAIYMLFLILFWMLLQFIVAKKIRQRTFWKSVNILGSIGMIVVILIVTISSRGTATELVLQPFASFAEARIQPEMYRSMFMNIFLFFPLGLTLPYALPEKWKRNALITVLIAFLLSFTVEFLQYNYHLGRAETDDVLCNTLGAFVGTLSYTLSRKFDQK